MGLLGDFTGPKWTRVPPAVSQPQIGSDPRPKLLGWAAWIILLGLLGYFIDTHVPRYFVYTAQSYGAYFWSRAHWLLPHVACGLLAVLIGPVQFWSGMRSRYMKAHRIAGRVYVAMVAVGAVASVGMAVQIDNGSGYSVGLCALALAWVTTTGMAFVAIRRRHIAQHKQWMVRSYVVTFAFVTFRLLDESMGAHHIMSNEERANVLAWACWAVPLLVTEVVLQSRAVFATRS
jgi:uncharacterized membrane protein